ncbi:MAG: extracellular solute-binding protein [Clostridiales bacterium]|nr:extracellular solute-binding protein [Clostridiales bacterium]
MKKLLALTLAVAMILSLMSFTITASAADTVTIKVPAYDRGFEGWNVTDNFYTQWIQSEFGDPNGINVQYVAIGRSTEVADFSQMLAAGNAPDIIFHYDMPQAVAYLNEGAIQELNLEEMKTYAPTYYDMTIGMIEQFGYMDGSPYFFFAERPNTGYNWVTLIRQDWLDQVGAEAPTNINELNAVLLQWKEAGLGVLNHQLLMNNFTYSYGFWTPPVDDAEHALYLDLNIADLTTEASEKYLKNLNYQYNNGLIDSEFYLNTDSNATLADFLDGTAGTYSCYLASGSTIISSLLANFPDAKVSVLDPGALAAEESNHYGRAYYPYGMIMGINAAADEETRIATWKFLEWMLQDDNLFKLENGVEGDNYTLTADGLAVTNPDFAGDSVRSNNNNKDYWCLWIETAVYSDPDLTYMANLLNFAPAGYEYLIEDSYSYFVRDAALGETEALWTTSIESRNEYKADLNTLFQELYVQCAMAPEAEFDAVYAAACEEYLDAGYQEILDEKTILIGEEKYR